MENDDEFQKIFDVIPKEVQQVIDKPKIIDVAPVPAKKDTISITPTIKKTKEDLAEEDFEFSRKQLKDLIETGQDALDVLKDLVQDTQHPRCFEAMSLILRNVSDSTKDLMDLHKKMKDFSKTEEKQSSTTNNNVLVTTTEDIIKLIKGNKNG